MAPEEAAQLVTSGSIVFVGSMGAEPVVLTAALWSRAPELHDVTVLTGTMLTGYPFLRAEAGGAFSLRTWFRPGTLIGGDTRQIDADFLPMSWAQTLRYLSSTTIDVALVTVSPADERGQHSVGISASNTLACVRNARLVIAQVNAEMPRTRGDSLVHESELDVVVHADAPLLEFPHRPGDDVDRAIGLRAAEHVPDRSTIQFGIGTIPASMLQGLIATGRNDLKILSQLTDAGRELIEAGACTTPAATVGEILGTRALYKWVDDNPMVEMRDGATTHGLASLCDVERFVSVNSALEVDLYGQVNSEFIDGTHVGGIGGSVDFALAAQLPGARSIIALRSTTRSGRPRIVPKLSPGAVTIQRTLVQTVVTEHGVADLRELSTRERALALAGIAAPEHRDELLRSAASL